MTIRPRTGVRHGVVLGVLLLGGGCVSDRPPALAPFDLRPASGRRVVAGPAALELDRADAATALASDAAVVSGSRKQLQIDLPSALAVAGARSVEVRYAEAKTEETRQAIAAAWGSLVPSIAPGVVVRAHRDNLQRATGEFAEVTKQQEFGGGAVLAQWQPGKVVFKALAAARRTDAAEAATETARADSALHVAEAYYELVRARSLVRIAEQALEEARQLARNEAAKERRGAGLKASVLRADAERAQKEVVKAEAESEVAVASARLVALLQLDASVELVPVDDVPVPLTLVSNEIPTEQLLERALVARPELRESEARVAASEREHEAVKWGPLVPEVDAGLTSGVLGPTFGQSIESNDFVAGVGWKIGPGGLGDLPAINAAAARVKQARIRDEGIRVEIQREVVAARAKADAADRELAAAREGVVAAQEALRLSTERFTKGAGIVLEVLDAQRAFTRAQTAEVEAIAGYDRAQYRLLRAIGEPITHERRG